MPNNPQIFNHLKDEQSPYLLQHVHNPVDWYPWGKLAFDKAKQEDKPVLLSVGYSTCHWCHVMAHESFEDEAIARIINEHFVAIKVDREERPDIDHIYMTATTALTGQGGWPMTVFLTPDARPFYAGTYFPPYAKWGSPGFVDVLNSIATAWKRDRENILNSSHSITDAIKRGTIAEKSSQGMNEDLLNHAFRQMRGQYDAQYGGFGHSPKFPMGHNLSYLLRYYRRSKNNEALDMVNKTLMAIGRGGIWDHLGGGFHRYSTDQFWQVPHFEKMLYDQALLCKAYLETYQLTGLLEFATTSREILDYVLREMRDESGGFYSAQDADSISPQDGLLKEGAYYVFSQSEIEEVLGEKDARIFNFCYGVLPNGNAQVDPHGEFVGKNILNLDHSLEEAVSKFNGQSYEIQGILTEGRLKLFERRNLRPPPHKDTKILCDWNGLMIASFAFAGRVLADDKYIRAAQDACDFILSAMMSKGRLLHRWYKGQAGIQATLEDYAFFVYGLLEVYEVTLEEKYLQAASSLTDEMIRLFEDPAGGFFMTAIDAEPLIMRPKEIYDGAIPSGNSVAAFVLWKIGVLKHQDIYHQKLKGLYACFASSVARAPYAHGFLLSTLDAYLEGAFEITFQGILNDPTMNKMGKVLYKHFLPSRVINFSPSLDPGRVQICQQGVCQLPVNNVEAFENQLIERSKI